MEFSVKSESRLEGERIKETAGPESIGARETAEGKAADCGQLALKKVLSTCVGWPEITPPAT